MKKKVLVIGASGFLGTALMQELSKKFNVIGTFFGEKKQGLIELDLNNSVQLDSVLNSVFPELIVLAAAETDVDAYELKPEISRNQIISAKKIVEYCKEKNCFLVFISTDAVFDGKKGNYNEIDAPNPICEYGRNKLSLEKIISSLKNYLILRTSVLYGLPLSPDKFIGGTILKLLKKEKVFVAEDWKRTPTLTTDLAKALINLTEKNQKGLFHAAGNSSLSSYETALAIAEEFNVPSSLIEKIKGDELKLPAKRPLDSSLNISKLLSLGIRMSSFEEGLEFIHSNL
ncbi:MAG: SDR family oxidoreductase [archaeon]